MKAVVLYGPGDVRLGDLPKPLVGGGEVCIKVAYCDIAMCGDHGIGECYGSVLDLPRCIAKGDDVCSLRYHKKEEN